MRAQELLKIRAAPRGGCAAECQVFIQHANAIQRAVRADFLHWSSYEPFLLSLAKRLTENGRCEFRSYYRDELRGAVGGAPGPDHAMLSLL